MNMLYVYWMFLTPCAAYIFLKGGPPERAGISIALLASIVSHLVVTGSRAIRFQQVEAGVFAVDLLTLAAFLILALRADRFWPLWITGIHLVGVATHTAMLVSPAVLPWVYGWIQGFWAYPITIIMIIATWRHQKRLRRFGVDSSWNASFAVFGRSGRQSGRIV